MANKMRNAVCGSSSSFAGAGGSCARAGAASAAAASTASAMIRSALIRGPAAGFIGLPLRPFHFARRSSATTRLFAMSILNFTESPGLTPCASAGEASA